MRTATALAACFCLMQQHSQKHMPSQNTAYHTVHLGVKSGVYAVIWLGTCIGLCCNIMQGPAASAVVSTLPSFLPVLVTALIGMHMPCQVGKQITFIHHFHSIMDCDEHAKPNVQTKADQPATSTATGATASMHAQHLCPHHMRQHHALSCT